MRGYTYWFYRCGQCGKLYFKEFINCPMCGRSK